MSKFDNDSLYDSNKFLVAKMTHLKDTLTIDELNVLDNLMNKVYNKHKNEYIVVNQDEEYIDEVWKLIKEAENKIIVGFIGVGGAGKDYQAHLLVDRGYKELAFADALRKIAFSSLNVDYDDGMKNYNYMKTNQCIEIKVGENYTKKITFRQFLEKLGTEGIRKYDNDFWCNALIKTIKDNNYKKVCISDMRFLNEYNHIKKFADENDYKFKVVFCDYHSDRYDYNNQHASAKLANYFVNKGYKDLQELTDDDFKKFEEDVSE